MLAGNQGLKALIVLAFVLVINPVLSQRFVVAQLSGSTVYSAPAAIEDAPSAVSRSLERFRGFVASGQVDEAVDAIRLILEADSSGLIRLDRLDTDPVGIDSFVPVRHVAHIELANASYALPELLQRYRRDTRAAAARLFERARDTQDNGLLSRVAEQFFLSELGDDALYSLGEIALEQGNFASARECWECLHPHFRTSKECARSVDARSGVPIFSALIGIDFEKHWTELTPLLNPPPGQMSWLSYPDTDLNVDEIRARLVLVSILAGDTKRAEIELELLRRLAPDVQGQLGGRDGTLQGLLKNVLSESRTWPTALEPTDWLTWLGSNDRNQKDLRTIREVGPVLWTIRYSPRRQDLWMKSSFLTDNVRHLPIAQLPTPLVLNKLVVLPIDETLDDVHAFHLYSGERAWPIPPDLMNEADGLVRLGYLANQSISVAADGMLFARVPIRSVDEPKSKFFSGTRLSEPSRLVAANLHAQKKLLFEVRLESPDWQGEWTVSGAPVVEGGKLYVVLRRRDGVREESHVASFDRQTGRLQWRRFVSANADSQSAPPESNQQQLLCSYGGYLFVNTNEGVIGAIRAIDGTPKWIVRYPRIAWSSTSPDHNGAHVKRLLNPCMAHQDLVIVAPRDCDRIFAIDIATGRLRWSTFPEQALDATYLLGVAHGNLVATGDSVYWINIVSGRIVAQFPPPRRTVPGNARDPTRGAGCGLLAGGEVVWPTPDAVLVFDALPSSPSDPLPRIRYRYDLAVRGLRGGHLIKVADVLLLSGPHGLTALRVDSDSNEDD